jgi:hypothetical protein
MGLRFCLFLYRSQSGCLLPLAWLLCSLGIRVPLARNLLHKGVLILGNLCSHNKGLVGSCVYYTAVQLNVRCVLYDTDCGLYYTKRSVSKKGRLSLSFSFL